MNVTEAIRARRSIRKYVPHVKMPEEHLHAILEAAMHAPSACNSRPWEFVVLQSDKAKEDALSIHPYASHLRDASLGILVCADEKAQSGIAKGFFPQDCGAAIENILLQSLELGYGSCWCGIYPNAERVFCGRCDKAARTSHKNKKCAAKRPHTKTTETEGAGKTRRPCSFAVGCESVTASEFGFSFLKNGKNGFSSGCQLPVQSALYARLSTLPFL